HETVSVQLAVMKWTKFYEHEPCGKGTPCPEGTYWLAQILERMVVGRGTHEVIDALLDVCDHILRRSFGALRAHAVSPISSGIKCFREEFLALCKQQQASDPALVGAAR